MEPFFCDIETAGREPTEEERDAIANPSEKYLALYREAYPKASKTETLLKNGPAELSKSLDKAAVRTDSLRIICIAYIIGDQQPGVIDERDGDVIEQLAGIYGGGQWVTWNGEEFDLPAIRLRALLSGNHELAMHVPDRRYDPRSLDLKKYCMGTAYGSKMHFDNVCRLAGIECKAEMSGADVPQAYRDGRMDDIVKYAKSDVIALRELYRRVYV